MKSTRKPISGTLTLLTGILVLAALAFPPKDKLHCIAAPDPEALKDFLRYSPDRIPFISTHRGGTRKGFPENCIPTFENTLAHTWSILEIDPRYTRDSAIVLMHDPTLERTSNGTGKVSEHTLDELKRLRLKDSEGALTAHTIPTLDEAIRWAKGKTLLVIDQKDVPVEARVKKIQEHGAQAWATLIIYSLEDARKCYAMDKDILMEVMIPDTEALLNFERTGIPWDNVMAFITHTAVKDTTIFTKLHERKVLCIRGSSRTLDKAYTEGKTARRQLRRQYREMVQQGTDIIETDLGIEAGEALRSFMQKKSSKSSYFKSLPQG